MDYRARHIVRRLYDTYIDEIRLLPEDWRDRIDERGDKEIIIADYISGMTVKFALKQYEIIYGTEKDI